MNEEQLILEIKTLAKELQDSHSYTEQDLIDLFTSDQSVPASIFSTQHSPLQALVTYLHDQGQPFNAIAKLTKRTYRAVWGAYQQGGITAKPTTHRIPLRCFNHTLSILESVVAHLKEHEHLKLSEIAKELGKDQRTIWTVYHRAQHKHAQDS